MKNVTLSCLKMNLLVWLEGWCVRLGQEGDCLHEGGGNCLKYLKRWWNRNEGSRNKNLKKGGWNPLINYGSILETDPNLKNYLQFMVGSGSSVLTVVL